MYTSKRGEHVAWCCVSSSVHDLRHCIIIYVEFIAPYNVNAAFSFSLLTEREREREREKEGEREGEREGEGERERI